MNYHHNRQTGQIIDTEDGQVIASMSESSTPEQANLLAAAPQLLKFVEEMANTRLVGLALEDANTLIARAKAAA